MRKFIGKMKLINELRLDLFVIIVWHTLVGMTIVGFIYNTSRANYIITLIDIFMLFLIFSISVYIIYYLPKKITEKCQQN